MKIIGFSRRALRPGLRVCGPFHLLPGPRPLRGQLGELGGSPGCCGESGRHMLQRRQVCPRLQTESTLHWFLLLASSARPRYSFFSRFWIPLSEAHPYATSREVASSPTRPRSRSRPSLSLATAPARHLTPRSYWCRALPENDVQEANETVGDNCSTTIMQSRKANLNTRENKRDHLPPESPECRFR